jgi:hypothetical protein
MALGFDTPANKTEDVTSDIQEAGYSFVCRYYGYVTEQGNLTLEEATTLSQSGLQIVAIWEDGQPTDVSYFSYAKGVEDGKRALNYAQVIGQPEGSAIYFAVDYDVDPANDSEAIKDYFDGVKVGLTSAYRVGVYGSGYTCSFLLDKGTVDYTWLAQSIGWHDYNQFEASVKWNLKQDDSTIFVGLDIDPNNSQGDFGGFTI